MNFDERANILFLIGILLVVGVLISCIVFILLELVILPIVFAVLGIGILLAAISHYIDNHDSNRK